MPDNSPVIALYAALLGLIFVPITLRVGMYRLKNKIYIGDGDDPQMLLRIRSQANFIETVPIALILFFAMESMGASATWLHALGITLVAGRILHYLGLAEIGPAIGRPIGMTATLLSVLVASLWILINLF